MALPEPSDRQKAQAFLDWATRFDPETARLFRIAFDMVRPDGLDPEMLRKSILRRYANWRYFGIRSRSAKARLISQDWKAMQPDAEVEPGSAQEQLKRLVDLGYRPSGYRKIVDDLDPTLD